MTDNEATLIDQIKCGDADALAKFIELRRPHLTGYIEKNLGPDYPWHGNVRELEQCVRSVLLKQDYKGDGKSAAPGLKSQIFSSLEQGDLSAHRLLSGYCKLLYQQHGTFEEVARRTGLDRRTVNKYIKEWDNEAAIDPSGPEAVPGSPTR